MKLSKQRIAYVGVLGVGLLALVADRTVLGPTGASAAAVSPSELGAIPEARPAAEPGVVARGGPSLSERLAGLEVERVTRDGFAPPATWVPAAAAAPLDESASAFVRGHRLTSIASLTGKDGTRLAAMINGRALVVGDRIGGFELVALGSSEATFRSGTTEATLRLPERTLGSDSR